MLPRLRQFPILLAAALLAFTSNAATVTGRVVGVSDGDTITVLDTANGATVAGRVVGVSDGDTVTVPDALKNES